MTQLPKMTTARRSTTTKPMHDCACGGCGHLTHRTWYSGHDGHCDGWAHRIEGGHLSLADVPVEVRKGVVLRLKRRGTYEAVIAFGNPRPQEQAAA